MKKVILTGTHGSGKTTLVNKYLKHQNVLVMHEMIRPLSKIPNFKFTFDKDDVKSVYQYAFSEKMLSGFYRALAQFDLTYPEIKLILMDRCILDPLYYSTYFRLEKTLLDGNTLRQSLINDVMYIINLGFFKDSTIILLKPLPLNDNDKFRLKGKKIQHDIYKVAKTTLQMFNLPYIECDTKEANRIIQHNLGS